MIRPRPLPAGFLLPPRRSPVFPRPAPVVRPPSVCIHCLGPSGQHRPNCPASGASSYE